MPSVRNILKDDSSARGEVAPKPSLEGSRALDGQRQESSGPSAAELIAERLRQGADQRAAFAQREINRLQLRVDQLQSQIEDRASQKLPNHEIKADLEEAHERLEDAKADLVRAHEARQNTDLTASLSHGKQEEKSLRHGQDGAAHGTSVRDALGKDAAAPKLPGGGPKRKI